MLLSAAHVWRLGWPGWAEAHVCLAMRAFMACYAMSGLVEPARIRLAMRVLGVRQKCARKGWTVVQHVAHVARRWPTRDEHVVGM